MVDGESATPPRSAVTIAAETVAVVFATLLLVSLGMFVVAFAVGLGLGPGIPDPERLIGWRLLPWLALVVVVEIFARLTTPRVRAGYLVLAAAVAGVLTTVVEVVLAARIPGQMLLTVFASGLPSVEFVLCGTIAACAVTALFGQRASPTKYAIATALVLALVIGAASMAALIPEWLLVYFRLGGPPPEVTPEQASRYILTASIGLGTLLLAMIGAFATGRRALGIIGLVLFVVGLLLALVLRVPEDLGTPPSPTYTTNPNYVPCYSGSGDCPGG